MTAVAQAAAGRRSLGALALLVALALGGCGKSATLRESSEGARTPAKVAGVEPEQLLTRNTARLGGASTAVDAAAVARTVYPGITRASRPATVVLVEQHDWPGALAASALAGEPLQAPLLYEEGESGQLPAVSAAALQALHPHGDARLGGAQLLTLGAASAPAGYRAQALAGPQPAAEAAAVARTIEALRGGHSHRVIVTNPESGRALEMPIAGLAAESGTPILYVNATGVPGATRTELERMEGPTIYVVGPRGAIGNRAMTALGHLGHLEVLPGQSDPVRNAIAVAEYEHNGFGWGVLEPGHGLVFLNEARPLDAPAAALLSATGEYGPALLLTAPDRIAPALVRYLSYIQPGYTSAPAYQPVRGVYNHGWLIGSDAAITAKVQVELDYMLEIAPRKSESSTTTE